MPLLAQSSQGDPIALAMVAVLLFLVLIAVLRKRFGRRILPATISPPPVSGDEALAPGCAGQLKLHDVDPKTAAMVMAIVADKMGKPLNQLRFISIEEVK